MIKKNNILITGGAGYIGSHIIEKLNQKKFNIIIFDNLITGYKKLINKKAIFIKGDIKNKKKLLKIINNFQIDSIIHLAAYLNISEAEKNKILEIMKNAVELQVPVKLDAEVGPSWGEAK